jgi:hypothetical protein
MARYRGVKITDSSTIWSFRTQYPSRNPSNALLLPTHQPEATRSSLPPPSPRLLGVKVPVARIAILCRGSSNGGCHMLSSSSTRTKYWSTLSAEISATQFGCTARLCEAGPGFPDFAGHLSNPLLFRAAMCPVSQTSLFKRTFERLRPTRPLPAPTTPTWATPISP